MKPTSKKQYRAARLKILKATVKRHPLPAWMELSDNGTVIPVVSKCENPQKTT